MPTKKGRRLIYARPSFLEGMARIFDLGGTLNEYDFEPVKRERDGDANGRKADDGRERDVAADGWEDIAEATRADWQAVGDDLRAVMGRWRYVPHCPACQAEAKELEAKG